MFLPWTGYTGGHILLHINYRISETQSPSWQLHVTSGIHSNFVAASSGHLKNCIFLPHALLLNFSVKLTLLFRRNLLGKLVKRKCIFHHLLWSEITRLCKGSQQVWKYKGKKRIRTSTEQVACQAPSDLQEEGAKPEKLVMFHAIKVLEMKKIKNTDSDTQASYDNKRCHTYGEGFSSLETAVKSLLCQNLFSEVQ